MTIFYILIGFIIGGLVIAMGGGGAAYYLGIMTAVAGIAPASAATTSLYTALPSLIIGAYSHYRTGNMRIHYANQLLITAVPATVVGSLISPYIPSSLYTWLIFIIFLILGIQVLMRAFKKKAPTEKINKKEAYVYGTVSGLMVGVAGLSGGGAFVAGLLLMGLTMPEAAATSSYALIVTSIVGLLMHITEQGNIAWKVGTLMLVGAIVGAWLMPHFLARFDKEKLTKVMSPIMGVLMIFMGTYMLLAFYHIL
ncbi:UPF0721 transmembrane protein [Philodulcilactobacillus myokoensis]|uniref:Probable membrane transporter protein n=1 Tax=Philodulcilactobacillus myokoensis TaxID=2929573 RepID=A0A9W6ESR6_9LACO|nr:sulfite exporter TauE/SafE family protein [Philodulcilactobacillus myokoensis]GLB46419.1 UPF0721 transmembrane protein [Philodulcilactobacillus myokoensis]